MGYVGTVHNTDAQYVSPILGNGEMVTTVGPTGYHDDLRSPHEHRNRTLVWAGRRMKTPTHALIRYGKIQRKLHINGNLTPDAVWQQSLDYDRATVISTLQHERITETTETLICMTDNVMIFHTTFRNETDAPLDIQFDLSYRFPTAPESRLAFPTMTHFTAPPTEQDLLPAHQLQTRHHNDGFSVLYHINDQLGEVRLGCDPMQAVILTKNGGDISHAFSLEPDESQDCWLWVMLGDRLTFTHFPDMARIRELIDEHQRLWRQFWNTSHIQLDNETLVNFRQTCLYTIRCNASRWSIPPAYLPAYWEGRTFHDELYPFLGLLSSGHIDLAARIPSFRLNTLPIALQYGGGHGARYPWETLESGEEGGPYGAWMDERFHIGQFVETVWRYYQYTGDQDVLMQLYPIMRDGARFFIYDVLIRDANGVLKTRRVTDFDEAIYPVDNGIFTLCSVIRTLETTAQAAQILNCDDNLRDHWLSLSEELHHALPVDGHYQVADGASHWHIAQMGSIYPFSFDVDSETARKTMTALYDALKTEQNVKPGSAESYADTHWMWVASMIATGFFYQGRSEEGYNLLENILNSAGPFLSCNEQQRLGSTVDPQEKYWLPWFTTSAGAFVHAINSMFVQVDEHGTVLFKGVSSQTSNVQFSGLLASDGVRVSAQLEDGQLQQLTVTSSKPQSWSFRLPESIAKSSALDGQSAEGDYVRITVQLDVGETVLLA